MNLLSLKNKTILVSGGYGHLGTAITKGLLEAEAKVIVLGRSEEKFLKKFENEDNVDFQFCDISSTESIETAFRTVVANEGKIDGLVNNAYYMKGQSPENMSDEEWQIGMNGTLTSVFNCIRAVIPYMKAKGGKIINLSSMYGMVSPDFKVYEGNDFLNPPHYGAAKAGILQLTKYYACYLGKYNIQVNAVSPGAFPNPNVQKDKKFIQDLSDKSPLGRIGRPEDLKGAFVLLSSRASDFITGQNIVVDGGWTAW